jgi:17-hydroxy-3-oxo-4-pregnene-20-carboxyl-CoA lyase
VTFQLRDRSAISGIGQTEFLRSHQRSELDLACDAILAACDDAGISAADIDGVVRYGVEQVTEVQLLYTLGISHLRFMAETPSGGGGLASTVALAALAVASGTAEHVVCFRSRKRSKDASYGSDPNQGGRPWQKFGTALSGTEQFHHPFGVAAPAQEMALIARRHMHVFGTKAEHFGMQAVAQRDHASRNPAAIMRQAITLDDWRESRMIADPIRLFDCSLECDGAVAVIVSAAERAADMRHRPAFIMAATQGEHPIHTQLADYLRYSGAFDGRDTGGVFIGRRLFEMAGVGPTDVDAAMIFDHFTMAIPLSLEQYGFCAMGEGGPFIESGATRWPEGSLPVNTHGGSNSEAFVHGFNHLPEAVRQLRGTAVNQVDGCEIVFVCGSITDPSGAILLRR